LAKRKVSQGLYDILLNKLSPLTLTACSLSHFLPFSPHLIYSLLVLSSSSLLFSRNWPLQGRDDSLAVLYAEAVISIAAELGDPVIDLRGAMLSQFPERDGCDGWSQRLMSDGLHLNPEGYRVLFEELMETLKRERPELLPAALPFSFPPWQIFEKAAAAADTVVDPSNTQSTS
jgi:hypothetical protein